jgi:hypothetical protein
VQILSERAGLTIAPKVISPIEQLRRLEKECNVIITVPKEVEDVDVTLAITGTEPDIAYAKSRVFELMTGEAPPLSMFAPKDREGNKTVYVMVHSSRVGLVIGKGSLM